MRMILPLCTQDHMGAKAMSAKEENIGAGYKRCMKHCDFPGK